MGARHVRAKPTLSLLFPCSHYPLPHTKHPKLIYWAGKSATWAGLSVSLQTSDVAA